MKLNELGFDYSNLTSCTITRKKYIVPFVGMIFLFVTVPMFIIFLVLLLLEVPIEMNGVMTYPYEPAYQQFFAIFLTIMGSLAIVALLLFLGIFTKPKLYMVIDKDTTNYDTYYYINNDRRNQIIYLTESYALIYNTKYDNLQEETDKKVLRDLIKRYAFWKEFPEVKNYKIKRKNKKTVLKYKSESLGRFRTVLSKTYTFSDEIQTVPVEVTEMLAFSSSGRNNIQAYNKFYFENINRRQHFEMHPAISQKLRSFI